MSTETEGIDQSNFFVVGITSPETKKLLLDGAVMHETEQDAVGELLTLTKISDLKKSDMSIFHVKVIGKLEKE